LQNSRKCKKKARKSKEQLAGALATGKQPAEPQYVLKDKVPIEKLLARRVDNFKLGQGQGEDIVDAKPKRTVKGLSPIFGHGGTTAKKEKHGNMWCTFQKKECIFEVLSIEGQNSKIYGFEAATQVEAEDWIDAIRKTTNLAALNKGKADSPNKKKKEKFRNSSSMISLRYSPDLPTAKSGDIGPRIYPPVDETTSLTGDTDPTSTPLVLIDEVQKNDASNENPEQTNAAIDEINDVQVLKTRLQEAEKKLRLAELRIKQLTAENKKLKKRPKHKPVQE